LKWIIAAVAFIVTFVVIPVAVRYHGKRFCSWICGCGGLAETLGDRWRHLSPKGEKSRRWEFMGTLVLFWAITSAFIILVFYQGNTVTAGNWHKAYSVIADFWLIAVIPMLLYPVLGGKIWCRYWCPLAKYMEILSRKYGLLAIKSNEKCIQCTQCSLYCQVGVDVMAFAKNGQTFSNRETSCIHCGICISVCPMDVLRFDRL
jgi:polyferredoxin